VVNYFDNPDYSVIVIGAGRGIGRAAVDLLAVPRRCSGLPR
jgi:NAD(P)-dependent dehydrogenase (short-subunit alcohol dehydrogenase family)